MVCSLLYELVGHHQIKPCPDEHCLVVERGDRGIEPILVEVDLLVFLWITTQIYLGAVFQEERKKEKIHY